jgi:hypothetical protein
VSRNLVQFPHLARNDYRSSRVGAGSNIVSKVFRQGGSMLAKKSSVWGWKTYFACLIVVTVIIARAPQRKSLLAQAEKSETNPSIDALEKQPGLQWSAIAGTWHASDAVEVSDVERRIIYRSPEEPSHVSWVGMWNAPDGSISIRFPQITGNPGLEPSYAPWYGRSQFPSEGMKNWPEMAAASKLIVGPPDAISTTRLRYITMTTHDQGSSWQEVSDVPGTNIEGHDEARGYNDRLVLTPKGDLVGRGVATLICHDGRIVDTAGFDDVSTETLAGRKHLLGLHESFDGGKTWTPMQWISGKYEDGKPVTQATEEHSLVELNDGRLLFIIRADEMHHPLAAWLTRHSDGKYSCDTPVVVTSMPHAGKPSMIRTSDGTIWYWGARHFYSLDEGRTWQGLPDSQVFPSYYGKMMAAGNHVLCITQKDIGDEPYPSLRDSSVEQIRFSGRRVAVMMQTGNGNLMAMNKLDGAVRADLHLRAEIRLDKADGIAFRVSPDGKSYYALMLVMPGVEARKRWTPPPLQGSTLSAYFPGMLDEASRPEIEKGLVKMAPRPLAVLARIDNGRITVLRGINAGEANPGAWVQVQIKVRGDLIQAAVANGSTAPNYLGVRDSTYPEGSIGLLTDTGSHGEFKDLALWSSPQMMRDLWTLPGSQPSIELGWASGTGASKPYN